MYKVTITNGEVDAIIHYSTADTTVPHLSTMTLTINKNQANIFNFKIYKNHQGYDSLLDLSTRINVTDMRNNTVKFEGRVLVSTESMSSNGEFYKEVVCESELAYLNDSRVGLWASYSSTLPEDAPDYAEPNQTIKMAIQKILNNHNANVDSHKQFMMGNVEIDDGLYFTTSYESSLDILLNKIINNEDVILKIRNDNSIRYLDVLINDPQISNTVIAISKNLKDFKKTPDYDTFCTRLIGLGADGITFESINDNKKLH